MAITIGGLIQDPDSLSYEIASNAATTTKELVIDTANLIIKLTRTNNLTADGVTLDAVYSKIKEIWTTDPNLTPLAFPFNPITNEQFELINGWNWDQQPNPNNKITVPCNLVLNSTTITANSAYVANFTTSNVFVNAYVVGNGTAAAANVIANANVQVTNVSTDGTTLTISANAMTTGGANLTFWADVDYTFNLIRTGGWALKATTTSSSQEEWMGVISLGSLGAQGLTVTTPLTSAVSGSNSIPVGVTVATTTQVGSFVNGPNIPYGTIVSSVANAGNGNITISKVITSIPSGAFISIKPKDQPYYVIGANLNIAPFNTVMPGQANNPVKIYGDSTHGGFDYRDYTNVFSIYTREQGYTFYQTTKTDIGFANLTYQTYRFPLVSTVDTNIVDSDATISSSTTANVATNSPWNNMRITWYNTPQARIINGVTYYANVIIDANILLAGTTTTYGTATAQQIYEFVQWSMRRPFTANIDYNGYINKPGRTTPALVVYSGTTLTTLYNSANGGAFIDHFRELDINNVAFADNTQTTRTYNYVAAGTLGFTGNINLDGNAAVYRLYFNQINQGTITTAGYTVQGSLKYGTKYAQIVKGFAIDPSNDGTYQVKGNLLGGVTSVAFDFPYDNNAQCYWVPNNRYYTGDQYCIVNSTGSTIWYQVTASPYYTSGSTWTQGTDGGQATILTTGPTVILAVTGLNNGQYASITGTLQRSLTNTITAVSPQEKNYAK
jgi:hypothetical protein